MRVVVVGGGVAGLCCAYYLRRRDVDVTRLGMVCATRDADEARKVLRSLEPMRAHGYALPGDVLGEQELHELEPALNDRVAAGFHLPAQWHVRADSLVRGLAARLLAMGVEVVEGADVTGFARTGDAVYVLATRAGDVAGDRFVLAAGSWTAPVAAMLGVRMPMEPGKGYSFLVTPKVMPRHGVLFPDIHAGATPLDDRVRIGGTMEFSGYSTAIDDRRISNLFEHARAFVDLETPSYEEPWAGPRPMTADGLPVLDRAGPYRNAFVATGYSMLGMTLAAPAGEAMAELVTTGVRPAVLEPFRLDRFPRRIVRRAGS